jgi:hypothetical protein
MFTFFSPIRLCCKTERSRSEFPVLQPGQVPPTILHMFQRVTPKCTESVRQGRLVQRKILWRSKLVAVLCWFVTLLPGLSHE